MSLGLMPYIFTASQLRDIVGCKDADFLEQICEECSEDLKAIDEQNEDVSVEGERQIPAKEAAKGLIMGTPITSSFNIYASVLEMIIRSYSSKLLENSQFCPANGKWFEEVDTVLQTADVKLRITELANGPDLPFLPPNNDQLGITMGCWKGDDIRRALPLLEEIQTASMDREIAQAIEQIKGWCRAAASVDDATIVGFCY